MRIQVIRASALLREPLLLQFRNPTFDRFNNLTLALLNGLFVVVWFQVFQTLSSTFYDPEARVHQIVTSIQYHTYALGIELP
ncbi:MAG: hypothetical protein QOH96_2845 [Blastocatellia bacterium]|jgi:hypothetical protein|nr:hypothetical protein [Blastocatellia bacterium]